MNSENTSTPIQETLPTPEPSPSESSIGLPSDSPLLALLRKNPHTFQTIDEAINHATELRTLRTSPQSLRASLASDAEKLSRKRPKKPTKQQQSVEDAVTEAIKAASL